MLSTQILSLVSITLAASIPSSTVVSPFSASKPKNLLLQIRKNTLTLPCKKNKMFRRVLLKFYWICLYETIALLSFPQPLLSLLKVQSLPVSSSPSKTQLISMASEKLILGSWNACPGCTGSKGRTTECFPVMMGLNWSSIQPNL